MIGDEIPAPTPQSKLNFRQNKGGKTIYSSQPKLDFKPKKGGHSESGKNLTNSDLSQIFRATSGQ